MDKEIMKTNQPISRQMGNFTVIQRTKDGFFNATELLKQWNHSSNQHKQVAHYTENSSTREYITALMEEENFKERNSVIIQSKGKNGGTWMHPLLFLDFAMWLNPRFKIKVLKFVQDEMIKFRNLAGTAYPDMCKALSSIIPDKNRFKEKIKDLARSLNIIVYGKHEHLMRNKVGSESELRELYQLEKDVAQWINLGLVKSETQLKETLNKLYYEKYPNVLPI